MVWEAKAERMIGVEHIFAGPHQEEKDVPARLSITILTSQSGSQLAPISEKAIFSLHKKESLLLKPIQWEEGGNKEIPDP